MTAYIYIDSTINTKSLTNADHSKIALMRKTAKYCFNNLAFNFT